MAGYGHGHDGVDGISSSSSSSSHDGENKCFKTIKQMNFRMALLAFKIWVVLLEGVFLAYGITSIPLSYN